jgi:histidyl-tRNA synthetase
MERKTYRAVRGMRDVLPEEIGRWRRLEAVAAELARLHGHREIRPPLVEETELFRRSVGEVTDIVEKEMFTVLREEHSFTLRPEGTAGVVRAYVEAGYAKTAPFQKFWYLGPMFRYERPQKGRERQFTQFGVECLGSLDPRLDAETIAVAVRFFEELGFRTGVEGGLEVRINSLGDGDDRDRFREAVRAFVAPNLAKYSEDSRRRYERNVLRILDSKDPGDVELNRGAPRIVDHLGPENRAHFDAVRAHLDALGVRAVVDPTVVRGLDYYTRTIFEVHYPALGARSALCGGGRYDHLVETLGGPSVPAVGFAIGFTGTLLAMEQLGLDGVSGDAVVDAHVVTVDESIADELRRGGIAASFDVEGRRAKAQMKNAVKSGARIAVVVGPDELARGEVQLKDLAVGAQEAVPRSELVRRARELLAKKPAERIER